jgi:DNA modification methylase
MPAKLPPLPTEVAVKRSDPIYNAHAYLTKVPYSAIVPFVESLTDPGDTVLDVFAGSGMTGVASVMVGRNAELRDISALGCHIGQNYLLLVDADDLREAARTVMEGARKRIRDVYAVRCDGCRKEGTLSKTVWSFQYKCSSCSHKITYYDAFKAAGWKKKDMVCPSCAAAFQTRGAERVGEVPVLDHVRCACSKKLREQPHSSPLVAVDLDCVRYPDVEIGDDRQMYTASALKKNKLLSTAAFFSERNLGVLAAVHREIQAVADAALRSKLCFAFTAILTRASKRYQWHPKRPLNAANQNYYIAPVFYEWNVYELFERKVDSAARSDHFIRAQMRSKGVTTTPKGNYKTGSADELDLPDGSVNYVFTDPPFGSQIFYSDMNLFQEAWLDTFTDHAKEAVVDRTGDAAKKRSADRYEQLIVDALKECNRVLMEDGWLSLVFSNSNGEMWLLVQRAIHAAGFVLEHVTLLDKGQRSVKGLTSGFESVVTSDLILTMRKATADERMALKDAPPAALHNAIEAALRAGADTPTRVYLSIITKFLRNEWKVTGITIGGIRDALVDRGYDLDPATGTLLCVPEAA